MFQKPKYYQPNDQYVNPSIHLDPSIQLSINNGLLDYGLVGPLIINS